jgi:hypothetical protein
MLSPIFRRFQKLLCMQEQVIRGCAHAFRQNGWLRWDR